MICVQKHISFRATLLGVALFLCLSRAFAAKTETYQDLIEKAYNLSLQKDRQQAISILVSAAKKESKKGQIPKELLTALDSVGNVFYSDKAQQLFELGLTLKASDLNLAMQRLNEASRLEPENQQIIVEQVRVSILLNDCAAALKLGKKALERNPYAEEVSLVSAQAALCGNQPQEAQNLRLAPENRRSSFEIYWSAVEIETFEKLNLLVKARDLSAALSKQDPNFPEAAYWNWKLHRDTKGSDDKIGRKYLNLCKNLSTRSQRQYSAEPKLCRRTSEVETELKKSSAQGEE